MTDGLPAYKQLGEKHTHLSANHSAREYARRRVLSYVFLTAGAA